MRDAGDHEEAGQLEQWAARLSSGGAAGGGAVTSRQGSRGGPPGWMISAMPMVPGRRLQGVAAALEAAGSWFGVVP